MLCTVKSVKFMKNCNLIIFAGDEMKLISVECYWKSISVIQVLWGHIIFAQDILSNLRFWVITSSSPKPQMGKKFKVPKFNECELDINFYNIFMHFLLIWPHLCLIVLFPHIALKEGTIVIHSLADSTSMAIDLLSKWTNTLCKF